MLNNKIKAKHTLSFYDIERFRYADACFETMLYTHDRIPLLDYHQKRLNETCEQFGFDFYNISGESIQQLIETQQEYQNVKYWRIRISLIRKSGQNYTPFGSQRNVLIECAPVQSIFNTINKLGFYSEDLKPNTKLAKYKTANALIYVKAKQFALLNALDDVLLKNENNFWIEASASNIFAVKNNQIYSPKENSGAVVGVFSQFLQKHYKITAINFTDIFLSDADEVFLTNAVQCVQSVGFLNNKQLKQKYTQTIVNELKEKLTL